MGLAVLWIAGDVLGPWGGFRCAVAAVATRLVIPRLHLAEWDVALAAGVGLAVVVACRNFALGRANSALWLVGYLGLAFGFLVKGAPALMLYAPGLLCAALITRRVRELFSPAHLAGVALFATIAGTWILNAAAAEKGLGWSWLSVVGAGAKSLSFLALVLPWSATLPIVMRQAWWRNLDTPEKRLAQSAAAFAGVGAIVLAVLPSHEMRYYLPLAVPVAVLCGMAAGELLDNSKSSKVAIGIVCVLAALLGISTIGVGGMGVLAVEEGPAVQLTAVFAGLSTVGFVAMRVRQKSRAPLFGLLLAAAVCFWLVSALQIEPRRTRKRSLRPVAEAFEPHLSAGEVLWTTPVAASYHHSSLTFYLRRPVRTVTETDRPPVGAHVLLFGDEPEDQPDYRVPFDYSVLATESRRGFDFTLARVE
jgi:4-amino-4-deoxy-L-arabinose transferase-like glycosyltransferase